MLISIQHFFHLSLYLPFGFTELHTRIGLAVGVTFPRVLGIEACGVVADCPGGEFKEGQQVCAMMGGMGRSK